ncbi:MFS transporter [Sulfurisphaera ohwakuensis]|uniref:MFS family permease n=1 Tax=Sulfurisphaera ohwakuensis TaxID=69656 RepID=A0A650CII3_SULOH|nr:MFS transporter [Sulfurisphaera ohwakuensis]MBB5253786.1 MFS family permease [Sulfurisphaera ohwakuensis]QGR17538.1 MFS transporter [Sulfurisphaera ohwakuensis]
MNWKINFLGAYLSWVMDSYDLGAVVITSTILGKLFYPTLGLLGAVLPIVFTVVFRPIGSLIFGLFADWRGRKSILTITVLGYSLAIGLTAFLPTYYQVGVLATVLLSILRVFQGIFIGGDVSSSFTLAMESIFTRRGLFSGITQSGTLVGFVIVDLLFTYFAKTPTFLITEGWRIIFLVGILPAILAIIIRYKVTESEIYLKSEKKPVSQGLRPIFQTILVMIGFWLMIYSGPQFVPVFLGNVLKLPSSVYGFLALIMNLVGIPAMILSGFLSDYIGRKSMAIIGSILSIFAGVLLYLYSATSNLTFLITAFGFLINLPSAITPAYLAERFKTYSRATGVGFSYNGAFFVAGFAQIYISLLGKIMPVNYSALTVLTIGALLAIIGLVIGPETLKVNELKIS